MRPTVPEQLDGIARILSEVVAPEVGAPYPADVLAGAVGTLRTLAAAHAELPAFLAWDADRTVEVLALIGVAVPPVEGETVEARQRRARAELEARVPELSADPEARAAMVALFRERADRFPLTLTGGPRADAAR